MKTCQAIPVPLPISAVNPTISFGNTGPGKALTCEITTLAFGSLNQPATSLFMLVCLLVSLEQGQKVFSISLPGAKEQPGRAWLI